MVGRAGRTTGTVHADVTLTRSKVQVKGLLNFQKLAKPCMHAGGGDHQPPSAAFWFCFYNRTKELLHFLLFAILSFHYTLYM